MSKLFMAAPRWWSNREPVGEDWLGVAPDGTAVVLRRLAASDGYEASFYVVAAATSVGGLGISVRVTRLGSGSATRDMWMRAHPFAAAWNAGEVLLPAGPRWAEEFAAILAGFDGTKTLMPDIASAASAALTP